MNLTLCLVLIFTGFATSSIFDMVLSPLFGQFGRNGVRSQQQAFMNRASQIFNSNINNFNNNNRANKFWWFNSNTNSNSNLNPNNNALSNTNNISNNHLNFPNTQNNNNNLNQNINNNLGTPNNNNNNNNINNNNINNQTKNVTQAKLTFYPTNRCTGQTYYRPNIKDLSITELQRYFNAIKKLNAGARPTYYDLLTKLHVDNYASVHSNAQFAAWHRAYLYMLEKELRKIDSTVTIPYWDWTDYSQHPEDDIVFRTSVFGGDGNKNNNNCVLNGNFNNFYTLYDGYGRSKLHCVRRAFVDRDNNGMVWTAPETVNKYILNAKTYQDFWKNLENGPHGVIHNGISSDFSGHASPNDPLFYSHHAFVDKLWFDWQKRNPNIANTYAASKQTRLKGMDYTVDQMIDAEQNLCYGYKQRHYSWTKDSNQLIKRSYSVTNTFASNKDENCDNSTIATLNIPKSNDRTNLKKLRVPEPLSDEFIAKFKLDKQAVRNFESQQRTYISNLNDDDSYVSPVALINSKKYGHKKCVEPKRNTNTQKY